MSAPRPLVVSAIGAFWPGNEASGPNQSFRALAGALRDEFDFHLLARDRPFRGAAPAEPDRSEPFAASHLHPGRATPRHLLETIRRLKPDLLWLNGFFDREFTLPILFARRLGLLPPVRLLLSPRGEFNSGALALKPRRKRGYLGISQSAGVLEGVTLHATGSNEADSIASALPHHDRLEIAPNISSLRAMLPHGPGARLRLVFVGRITPVKNLDLALRVLGHAALPLQFDIFGPVEDHSYFEACRRLAEGLPPQVCVSFHGTVGNERIASIMAQADLFFLPTAGENFGHAIFEALGCGVPVLISDRTPWRRLAERGAGWDLPLHDPDGFARAIVAFAALSDAARLAMRRSARIVAETHVASSDAVERNREMLARLCAA